MQFSQSAHRSAFRRLAPLVVLFAGALALSGCATAVIGSITVSQLSAIAGATSTAATGRGLQDHALSALTGRDCRLLEGIFRADRRICEEPGSPATENDFRGVVVMLMGPQEIEGTPQTEPQVLYAGLASDFRPSLARSERRAQAEITPLPTQMASLSPAQPMLRPGTHLPEHDARVVYASLGPALSRTVRRTAASEIIMAADDAGGVPSVLEWANAQPAPTITTVRLAVN